MSLDELDHAIDLFCAARRQLRRLVLDAHGFTRVGFYKCVHGQSVPAAAPRLFSLLREVAPGEPVRIELPGGISLVPTAECERLEQLAIEREQHVRAVAAHHTARLRTHRPDGD